MASIITGNGLGVLSGSLTQLNGAGALGDAAFGQGNERVFVNASTGNLVIQQRDENLVGSGLDSQVLRTYNSQGAMDDDNGDNWRIGFYRSVRLESGSLNAAGSVVVRVTADGAEQRYAYDASQGAYISTDGSGAHDTLSYAGGQWTFEQGGGALRETYSDGGYLTSSEDRDGNQLTYGYTIHNNRLFLAQVNDLASNQTTYLDYNGDLLARVRVVTDGVTQARTRYTYDALNRLAQVSVDLSPEDNSISDGQAYLTTYTYDGNSTRIASIAQSDGTALSFTYIQVNGDYRVRRITNAAGEQTNFFYDVANRRTDVNDGRNWTTSYYYDSQNRLSRVLTPGTDQGRLSTYFHYDNDDNLIRVLDDQGMSVEYVYDANGNQTVQRDALGNTIERIYDGNSRLLNETTFLVADPDGSGSARPSEPQTSRYAYDAEGHLRFSVDAEGGVTEHRYDGYGQRVISLTFTHARYEVASLSYTETLSYQQLYDWAVVQDPSQVERVDRIFDFRGNVASETTYQRINADGTGVRDGSHAVTRYVYDPRGRLLSKENPRGVATSTAGDYTTYYAYDGLGRLLSTTDGEGRTTLHQFDAANQRTVTTAANGLITTTVYDDAGRVVSVSQSGGGDNYGITTYKYDAAGNRRVVISPTGASSHKIYDKAGRLIGEIDPNGLLTEYVYDNRSQLVQTIQYEIAAANMASLLDSNDNPVERYDLSGIRPSGGTNRITRQVYDAAGRLVYTIDPEGYVSEQRYDGAGNVIETLRYAQAVSFASQPTLAQVQSALPSVWTEDFDDGRIDGFEFTRDETSLQNGMVVEDGHLAVHTAYNSSSANSNLLQSVSDFSGYVGQTYRAELTVGDNVNRQYLMIGLDNGRSHSSGQLNRHVLYIGNGQIYVQTYNNSVGGNEALGAAVSDTTYVFELEIDAGETRLYVFEKGTSREDGWSRVLNTTWDQARFMVLGLRHPDGTLAQVDVDNLARYAGHGPMESIVRREGHTYDAAGRLVASSDANGVSTRNVFDAAGNLVEVIEAEGLPEERRTRYVYNARGQQVYAIDAEGYLTETRYTLDGQVEETIQYAEPVGQQMSADTAYNDPVRNLDAWEIYDADPAGATLNRVYDAELGQYVIEVSGSGTSNGYRLWSDAGNLSWDNREQFLLSFQHKYSENFDVYISVYTEQGHRYLNYTPGTYAPRTAGSNNTYLQYGLTPQFRDGNWQTTVRDLQADLQRLEPDNSIVYVNAFLIRGSGRIGEVRLLDDAKSLDRFEARKQALIDSGELNLAEARVTSYQYDRNGRLAREINHQGTATDYQYDSVGNLTETTTGIEISGPSDGHAERTSRVRYDIKGRVIAELSAEGVSRITTGMSQAQIDDIWRDWGIRHDYDLSGRRIKTTDQYGHSTLYFYDISGRLRYTVNHLGEVTEQTYNRFGEVEYQRAYNVRISTSDLDGGLITSTLSIRLSGQDRDSTHTTYTRRGQAASTSNDLGQQINYTYNAFGELVQKDAPGANGQRVLTAYQYDARGLSTAVIQDTLGQARTTTTRYDAFGRAIEQRDAAGNVTTTEYDQLGRVLVSTDPLNHSVRATYDAFGRVMTRTDARGHTTTYSYNESNRSFTITTPEGISTTTVANRYGEEVSVTDGDGYTTTHRYNLDGQLVETLDAHGESTETRYWRDGRVYEQEDERGVVTRFNYDEVGRLHQRIVDPDGLRLTTTTQYDAQGRVLHVTDERNITTRTEYDEAGRVARTVQDYATNGGGLNIETEYTYDDANNQISVTEAVGQPEQRSTRYIYDSLNQLRFTVDAEGYVTEHRYDNNGQVIERLRYAQKPSVDSTPTLAELTSAVGSLSVAQAQTERRVYDAAGQLRYLIDAEGYVTENVYNANGQVAKTVRYAEKPNLDGIALTEGNLASRLNAGHADNRIDRFVFDADGREIFHIDAENYVTETVYNDRGLVMRKSRYATPADVANWVLDPDINNVRSRISSTDDDRHQRFAYDGLGQLRFSIDGDGYVEETVYTARGEVKERIQHADPVRLDDYATAHDVALALRETYYQGFDGGDVAGWNAEHMASFSDAIYAQGDMLVFRSGTTYSGWPNISRQGPRALADGDVYRADVTTGANADGGRLLLGIESNNSGERRFAAYFDRGTLRVQYNVDGTYHYHVFGQLSDQTTYSVELARDGNELVMYVYEKGQDRTQGQSFRVGITASEWTGTRMRVYVRHGSDQSEGVFLLHNTSESTALDQVAADARREVFDYDAAGRVETHTDATGTVTHNYYNSLGELYRIVEAEGTADARETRRDYDRLGRLESETIGYGTNEYIVQQFGYDAFGNQTTLIDPRGFELANRNTWWAQQQRAHLGYPTSVSNLSTAQRNELLARYTKTQTFDKLGRKLTETNGLGHTTRSEYDAFGNIVKVTDPKGEVGYFYYGKNNKVALAINPERIATHTEYNAFGEAYRETVYDQDASAGYNATMSLEQVLSGYINTNTSRDVTTETDYNRRGEVTHVDYAIEGIEESFTYSAFGQKLSHTNKNQYTFEYRYDHRGNLVREIKPATTTTSGGVVIDIVDAHEYNAFGERVRSTLAQGAAEERVNSFVYDKAGRVVEEHGQSFVVEGVGTRTPVTRYTYDRRGNLIKTEGPDGASSYMYYDVLDRKITEIDAERAYRHYIYDSVGNLAREHAYDNLRSGTITETTRPSAPTGSYREQIHFYDVGNRKVLTRVANVDHYTYGSGFYTADIEVENQYDANGNLVRQIDANGNITHFFYGRDGTKIGQVDGEGYFTRWWHDARGIFRERRYATQLTGSQLAQLTPNASVGTISGWLGENRTTEYVRDALGRVTQESVLNVDYRTVNVDTGALSGAQQGSAVTQYTYDGMGNVVSVLKPGFSGEVETFYAAMPAVTGGRMGAVDGGSLSRTTTVDYGSISVNVALPDANAYGGGNFRVTLSGNRGFGSRSIEVSAGTANTAVSLTNSGTDPVGTALTLRIEKRVGDQWITLLDHGWTLQKSQVVNPDYQNMSYSQWQSSQTVYLMYPNMQNDYGPYYVSHTGTAATEEHLVVRYVPETASAVQLRYKIEGASSYSSWINLSEIDDGTWQWASPNRANGIYDYEYRVLEGSATIREVRGQFDVASGEQLTVLSHLTKNSQIRGVETVSYDTLGRKTRESQSTFTDYLGRSVTPTITTVYDAHGNVLTRTQEGVIDSEDRTHRYSYDAAGLLRYEIDAEGGRVDYGYNHAGRKTDTRQTVTWWDNSTRNYSVHYEYDDMGRVLSEQANGQLAIQFRYNAHGEMVAKGTNGQYQEFFKYDKLGRVFMSNTDDGVARAYFYDGNGNATIEVTSQNTDLSGMSIAQVRALSSSAYQATVSVYDGRNQVTDTYQAGMDSVQYTGSIVGDNWETLSAAEGGVVRPISRQTVDFDLVETTFYEDPNDPYDGSDIYRFDLTINWGAVIDGYGDGRVRVQFLANEFTNSTRYLSASATNVTISASGSNPDDAAGSSITVRIQKETDAGWVQVMDRSVSLTTSNIINPDFSGMTYQEYQTYKNEEEYFGRPVEPYYIKTYGLASSTGTIEERVHFERQPTEADYMRIRYKSAGSSSWGSWRSVPRHMAGHFVWNDPNLGAGTYDYEYQLYRGTGTASGELFKEAKGQLSVGSGQSLSVISHLVRQPEQQVTAGGMTTNVIHRSQDYNAYGEIIAETSGGGYTTNLEYNALGLLTKKTEPQVEVMNDSGQISTTRPVYE